MATRTDKISDYELLIAGDSWIANMNETAQTYTVAPNLATTERAYAGNKFRRMRPVSTAYSIDLGDIDYDDESVKLYANRLNDMYAALFSPSKNVCFFGKIVTEGLTETDGDDLVVYGVSVMADGTFYASVADGCAHRFSLPDTSTVEFDVDGASIGADGGIYVFVDSASTTGALTLTVGSQTAQVDVSTQGVTRIEMTAAMRAALSTADKVSLDLSAAPSATVTGAIVLGTVTGVE